MKIQRNLTNKQTSKQAGRPASKLAITEEASECAWHRVRILMLNLQCGQFSFRLISRIPDLFPVILKFFSSNSSHQLLPSLTWAEIRRQKENNCPRVPLMAIQSSTHLPVQQSLHTVLLPWLRDGGPRKPFTHITVTTYSVLYVACTLRADLRLWDPQHHR